MVVREEDDGFAIAVVEEFGEDGKAGMTTRFSLTGSVVNLSLPVQQQGASAVSDWQHQEWSPQEDTAWLLIERQGFAICPGEELVIEIQKMFGLQGREDDGRGDIEKQEDINLLADQNPITRDIPLARKKSLYIDVKHDEKKMKKMKKEH